MAIRKNKKTSKWEFDYKDLKGRRQIKKGFKTKAEAEKAQLKMIDELKKGLCPADSKTTFKEAAKIFMQLHAEVNCKPSTKQAEETQL